MSLIGGGDHCGDRDHRSANAIVSILDESSLLAWMKCDSKVRFPTDNCRPIWFVVAREGLPVRTVEEYRENAAECRKLARLMTKPEDKKALERMAQTWERLAQQRKLDLEPEPEG